MRFGDFFPINKKHFVNHKIVLAEVIYGLQIGHCPVKHINLSL